MIQDRRVACIILTGVSLMAVPASAQSYERMDRNRDGVITRGEWRGAIREFRQRDWNRDGVLSGDEIHGRRSNGSPDEDGFRGRNATERTDRAMDRLDRNNSGAVEGYEWPYNASIFRQMDRDGDGMLTQDEIRNMNQATMRDLDANHNNRIDDDEWPGGFAQFDRLDQNNDGRVSAREYYDRGGDWQRRRRFEQWDTNNDSRISMDEWQSSAALFRRLDRNRDNALDMDEYMGNTERYDRPFGWRNDR
jgi:hypothetical protein